MRRSERNKAWTNRCPRGHTNVPSYLTRNILDTPSILYSTKPVLYETGYKEYPYAFAGSCFPVRWNDKLYIVSAYHCFENHEVLPEKTLYPIPNYKNKWFRF